MRFKVDPEHVKKENKVRLVAVLELLVISYDLYMMICRVKTLSDKNIKTDI